jgi:BASS family bile acid:Na+ symporter
VIDSLVAAAVPLTNFALLLAVGMDLTREDFARVARNKALVVAGLVAPCLLLPPLAIALIRVTEPSPAIAGGLLLIAASPIGGISNAYSYLARASTALSVTLTGLSCLLASATIPIISAGIEAVYGRRLGFVAPIPLLVTQLTLMLLLPVALGMAARAWAPAAAARHRPGLQRFAFVGIALVLSMVLARDFRTFAATLPVMVPLAGLFVVGSLALGWGAAMPFSRDPRDRFTMAAEFGTRNIAVAITIAVTLLGRAEFAPFAAVYALIEVPILLGAVAIFRRSGAGGIAAHGDRALA